MEEIMNVYRAYKGIKPLFSEYEIFDWYDGPMSGIGRLTGTNEFYLFSVVAWDIPVPMRIFSIVKIVPSWLERFSALADPSTTEPSSELMDEYFRYYLPDIYLLKAAYIDNPRYELIKCKITDLEFYRNVEDIANQSEGERQKWFNLFSHTDPNNAANE